MNEPLTPALPGSPEDTKKLRIAVVGAGPGGYAAAFLAADLGLQVTLIDPEVNPGGVCLYRGCIPSKALLHIAKLIEESQQRKTGESNLPPRKSIWSACAPGKRV
jgi:pyruvate/2-oxoglutarate dehydrogenase complex dihydrolipoamide dehydrogenase (E3) component